MLDFLNQYPAPSRKAAIQYVKNALYTDIRNSNMTDEMVTLIISKEIDDFGSFGSHAAWLTYIAEELVCKCKYVIVEQPNHEICMGTKFVYTTCQTELCVCNATLDLGHT